MINGLSDFDGDIDAFVKAVSKALENNEPVSDFARRQFLYAVQQRMTLKDRVASAVKKP
jgi:hypothetical protein